MSAPLQESNSTCEVDSAAHRRHAPRAAGRATATELSGHIEGLRRGHIAWLPQHSELDASFPIDVRGMVASGLWRRVGALGRFNAEHRRQCDAALAAIKDPLSQLVAAGVLFRSGRATPAVITQAVDTASARGWRRPLLAWLKVQQQRAQSAGDANAAAALQRRIDLVAPPR